MATLVSSLPSAPPLPSSYVSFASLSIPPPAGAFDFEDEQERGEAARGLLGGIKRLFGGGGGSRCTDAGPPAVNKRDHSPTHAGAPSSTHPSQPGASGSGSTGAAGGGVGAALAPRAHKALTAVSSKQSTPPPLAQPPSSSSRAPSRTRTRSASRPRSRPSDSPSREPPSFSAKHSAPQPIPFPSTSSASHPPPPPHPHPHPHLSASPTAILLPNGQRFVRPTRISGAAPSLARVSLQTAEKQQAAWPAGGTAAWVTGGASGGGGAGGGTGTGEESPTLSMGEGFEGAEQQGGGRKRRYSLQGMGMSIGSLALRRTATLEAPQDGGDARSVMSISTRREGPGTAAGGAGGGGGVPTAMEQMRKVHGTILSKQLWMPNEAAKECTNCQAKFAIWNRKHHCRICGHIFCGDCTSHHLANIGRVCHSCNADFLRLKARPSRSSFDNNDAASLSLSYSYRGHNPSHSLSHTAAGGPLPPNAAKPGSPYALTGAGAGAGAGYSYSRPSSLHQSYSYLHNHQNQSRRPRTPAAIAAEEDHISERSSRPVTPESGDGEDGNEQEVAAKGEGAEEKKGDGKKDGVEGKKEKEGGQEQQQHRQSPKTNLQQQQQQKQLAMQQQGHRAADGGEGRNSEVGGSEADGGGGGGGTAARSLRGVPEEVQSPTLSAVPFRKDLGEEDDDDRSMREGGENESERGEEEKEDEGEGDKDGLGIFVEDAGDATKGLGLDLGENLKIDTSPVAPATPRTSQQPSTTPVPFPVVAPQLSPLPASSLFPDFPAPRHSPSVPQFDRSTSRLSLFGASHSGIQLLPFDVVETGGGSGGEHHDLDVFDPPAQSIPFSEGALEHIRQMIKQSLERDGVPHAKAWAVELERLLHLVAERLSSLPYRHVGEDLDVRDYVRVKRIPGGRPRDSEFVSGVVITKNLMHKEMPRKMVNPKIMLLSHVPLDFDRGSQYLSLATVTAQADPAVDILVSHINYYFPDLILVEETVSHNALKLLRSKGIAAARNVKPSALEAVSRAIGADIVTSEADLQVFRDDGNKHHRLRVTARCPSFRVQTFVHHLIPGGRKTILRFEGDDAHKPCTLILRGESFETLAKLKKIVRMLVLVVYNAKLEGYLMHDQRFLLLPSSPASSHPPPRPRPLSPTKLFDGQPSPSPPPAIQDAISQEISMTLQPYSAAALSGSALIQYPPPYPLARMADEDRKIREMREAREAEETQRIIEEEAASRAQSIAGGSSSASLDELGSIQSSAASAPQDPPSFGGTSTLLIDAALLARRPSREVIQHPAELVKQTAFVEEEERHRQYLVAWGAYRRLNADSLDPVKYQQLYVLESLLVFSGKSNEPNRLCRPPTVNTLAFYCAKDKSIGKFLKEADEDFRVKTPCPSPSCHEPLSRHQRVYVHDNYVVKISSEEYDNSILHGRLGMSIECRHEGCPCANLGRLQLVSTEASRISFAKFLEYSFYPSERLACADFECGHDGQLDHVRYWHFESVRVAIRMERIDLRDVVAPPRQVKVRPDRRLELRNNEYDQVLGRSEAFFNSVQVRLANFKYDCIPADRQDDCHAALEEFKARCDADRKAVARLLKSTYEHAQDSNGTEMTVVRRVLQEKSHAFDADWAAFAKKVMPAEAPDMRRVSTTQLKRLFPDSAAALAVSPGRRTASSNLTPALEIDEMSENSENSENSDGPLSPASSSDTSSFLPADSASTTSSGNDNDGGDASSVLSADVQIEPPHLHVVDASNDSSLTILTPGEGEGSISSVFPNDNLVADSAFVTPPPRSPRLPRSPTMYRPSVEESDLDSDSTVCADGDPTLHSTGTLPGRTASPFIRRQLPPVLDETSAAESEMEHTQPIWARRKTGHHVASLVDAFESTSSLGRSPSSGKKHPSPSRPNMRRAHTEKPAVPKPRVARPPAFMSDGDNSYARNVGVSHLMDHQLNAAAARPTRIPARKPVKSSTSTPGYFDFTESSSSGLPQSPEGDHVFGLGLSLSPNSSRAPSRASSRPISRGSSRPPSRPISPTTSRSRIPTADGSANERCSSRPPLTTFSSSRSTIKGKSKPPPLLDVGEAGRNLQPTVARTSHLSRPTASSASKMTSRRVVSTGTGGRVTNMRRHWDTLAAAAEKRQALRKRARPIITSQPTLQVFDNIRDAIKEDSDDEHDDLSVSGGDSDGADDEFDDEFEGMEHDDDGSRMSVERSPLTLLRETTIRPPSDSPSRPPEPKPTLSTSSMADALVRSVSVAALDPSAMLAPSQLSRPPPSHEHLSRSVEPSDSEFASVPPSPVMPDSFTFPRMSEGESSGAERKSIFNAFSSLWTYRNGDFSPLAYPTIATEHVYADNPVVLRDDEPTSIIAHTLSSKKYFQAFETTELPRIREALSSNKAESIHNGGEGAATPSPDPELAKTIEDLLRASSQRSFKLGDVELGDISARCTVFWVEQFEALRRQCGCDNQFIESLSRCFKWDAVGGKSKVDFMKTLDDRFIVKQLSRPEMEVFARFAPAYFQYMADALFQGKPTVLAKVFGIYRISLGKHYRNVDFLVMENLFYGRQLNQIFDLKGSTRNRRADESNPVLLDENLLELSLKNPFYVREESKQFIKQAIFNDSQFLSDLNVMDYSLVVGVDAVNPELCVGIVDYIRTYTWDKRIESWVKETTFLGGASKSGGPTVITPKQYKMRFREAIDGYLLLSPTPWLNTASLLPVNGGDRPSHPYGAADTASLLIGGGGGGSTREALTVPPTPSLTSVSSFAAQAMSM